MAIHGTGGPKEGPDLVAADGCQEESMRTACRAVPLSGVAGGAWASGSATGMAQVP
jgi:hypothetical protein